MKPQGMDSTWVICYAILKPVTERASFCHMLLLAGGVGLFLMFPFQTRDAADTDRLLRILFSAASSTQRGRERHAGTASTWDTWHPDAASNNQDYGQIAGDSGICGGNRDQRKRLASIGGAGRPGRPDSLPGAPPARLRAGYRSGPGADW